MSENERKRRLDYRKIRKQWISWQAAILAVILLVAVIATAMAIRLDKTYYIDYYEQSKVDYGVYLKENEFYEQDYLGKEYAYVASLIDRVAADFRYEIHIDSARNVDFEYTYRIDGVLEIVDSASGKTLFAPVFEELPAKSAIGNGKVVLVQESIQVDYAKYNDLATRFVETHGLNGAKANLLLQMHVNVKGESEEFSEVTTDNAYVVSISVPLTSKAVDVQITSDIPDPESKILSYSTSNSAFVFRVIAIVFGSVGAILAVGLVGFIYLTRNTDITYEIKVNRIYKSYKSFIQKIKNEFDMTGYQVLLVEAFDGMLEIRDTIQSPILMYENEDKTCTNFLIPTNTKLLYLFEIKVDDYDEIYNHIEPAPAEPVEEVTLDEAIEMTKTPVEPVEVAETVEAVEVEETVVAEEAVAVAAEPEVEPVSADDADEDADEGIGYTQMRKSFTAKLMQASPESKSYYSEVKNELLSYRKVKSRTSWNYDSFNRGRIQLAKIGVRGKTVCLYLALNPADYVDSKYFCTDFSDTAQYQTVPMMVKIKSGRGVKYAKELIATVMAQNEIEKAPTYEPVDYAPEHATTEELIEMGLIKDPSRNADVFIEEVELVGSVSPDVLTQAMETPDEILSQIDYVDTPVASVEDGVEVIDVVWKETEKGNRLHQYDPNGAKVSDGDIVLVPTEDATVIRKAAVAHANYNADPATVETPLQKIIGVLKRKVQAAIVPNEKKKN